MDRLIWPTSPINSGSVSVISTLLRRVVATVPVGPGPNAVVAAPNGRAVYVGLDTNIAVIDTLTQRVTRYIDDPDGAFELDISPDGQRLYADSGGGPMLSVFDTRSGRLIESMNLGTDSPGALAVSRDGRTLYAGIFSKPFAVDVIDTGSFRVTARVPVALNPMGIALSPRGRELYVTNWGDFSNPNNFIPGRAVQVIDNISLQASSPIQVGLLPTAIAFAPDGRHAYVANSGSNSVSVILTRDRKVVADLGVGFIPQDVAVTPNGRQAYVTNTGRSGAEGNTVSVLPLLRRE
jgi:YVTN family beta-propeller protein